MKLARKLEYKGQYWAQKTDGSWVRWSALAGEWIEQIGPPPFDTYEGPGFAAGPAPALAGAGGSVVGGSGIVPGEPNPMGRPLPDMYQPTNPVDRWWNKRFPPHSNQRLVFFLIALPIVAFLIGILRDVTSDRPFSWGQFWFVVIAGDGVLALLWLTGSLRPGEPDASPQSDEVVPAPRPARKANLLHEFALTISISFVGVTLMGLIMWPETALKPASLLTTLGSALAFTILMMLRRTVWSVIILSILVGLPAAIMFELFFLFLGGGDDFLVTWAIMSVLAFTMFFPPWYRLRKMGFMGGHKEPRLWVLLTGTFLIAVTATYFVSWDYKDEAAAEAAFTENMPPPITGTAPQGAPTREEASRGFFSAWVAGTPERAAVFGTEQAVEDMFAYQPGSGQMRGCGTDPGGYIACVVAFPDQLILLYPERDWGNDTFYIHYIKKAPLDTQIHYLDFGTTQPTTPATPTTDY